MRILLALALASSVSPATAGPTPYPGVFRTMRCPALAPTVAAILLLTESACQTPTGTTERFGGRVTAALIGDEPPEPTDVTPISADTYVRKERPNANLGTAGILRVKSNGNHRTLVRVDPSVLQGIVGGGTVEHATLELTIAANGDNWGPNGRDLAVHRMNQPWTETGATWNCANDPTPGDRECDGTPWRMERKLLSDAKPWDADPSAVARIRKFQTGTIAFDVTDDVLAFLGGTLENHGWVVKKEKETLSGHVAFASRESATPPQLLLTVQQSGQASIPPEGGTVTLEGVGSITFPAGAFGVPTDVELDSLTSPIEDAIFAGSSSGSTITDRLTYVLRVLADENPSGDTDVEVAIEVPDRLASRVDGNESLVVWIRICQCTEFERIDNYLPPSLATTFDSDAGVLRTTVPAAMFTKLRRGDGRAELLIMVTTMAIQPLLPQASFSVILLSQESRASSCELSEIGSSLPSQHIITEDREGRLRGFNDTTEVSGRYHYGVDYRAPDSTLILAVRDGIVDSVAIQIHSATGDTIGWGQYVRLLHFDGTRSLYAHLHFGSGDHLSKGDTVSQGEVIGLAGETGGADGAHLHLEFFTPTWRRVDPHECLQESPFSGIWVGPGPFALHLVSDPHGIIGGGAGPPRLGRIESSRWVLRQTADGVVGTGEFTATGGLSEELEVELGETPPEFVVLNEYPRFNLANVNPPLSTTFPFVPLDLTIVSVGGTIIQATPSQSAPTVPDTLLVTFNLVTLKRLVIPDSITKVAIVTVFASLGPLTRKLPDFATVAPALVAQAPSTADQSSVPRNTGVVLTRLLELGRSVGIPASGNANLD